MNETKLLYGMTARKVAQLKRIGQDETIEQKATALTFFNVLRNYVAHARDLARSGKKDDARDWYRCFETGAVVKVISHTGAIADSSLEAFKAELKNLGTECHPEDGANWATDIQAIRHSLELLTKTLARKKTRTVTRSRSGFPKNTYEPSFLLKRRFKL